MFYSSTNFRTLGKFKSEMADVPPTEFCGFHSKMYSLSTLTGDREYRKAKGVPKLHVKKHVTHEQYLHVLRRWSWTTCRFRAFRLRNHRVTMCIMSKVCRASTTSATCCRTPSTRVPTAIATSLPMTTTDLQSLCAPRGAPPTQGGKEGLIVHANKVTYIYTNDHVAVVHTHTQTSINIASDDE